MTNLTVNQSYESEPRAITVADITKMAELTGDKNPIHLDQEYASNTRFAGIIAHGLFCNSLISKTLGMEFPGEGTVYLSQTLKYKKPVYVGDEIRALLFVEDINEEKNIYTIDTMVLNQTNDVVAEGEAKILLDV